MRCAEVICERNDTMENKALVKADFDKIAMIQEKKWDHNRHYHNYLLKHLGKNLEYALDIGCGKGEFAKALAHRAKKVIGVDLSEQMISMAKADTATDNIEYVLGDVMELELENSKYDCIASIATMHHLPLEEMMRKAKAALKDKGVFMVLDLYQEENILDYLTSAAAIPFNILMMLMIEGRVRPSAEEMNAWREHGKHDRYLTLKQIKAIADQVMPGSKIKRHFYWRYSIIWQK